MDHAQLKSTVAFFVMIIKFLSHTQPLTVRSNFTIDFTVTFNFNPLVGGLFFYVTFPALLGGMMMNALKRKMDVNSLRLSLRTLARAWSILNIWNSAEAQPCRGSTTTLHEAEALLLSCCRRASWSVATVLPKSTSLSLRISRNCRQSLRAVASCALLPLLFAAMT